MDKKLIRQKAIANAMQPMKWDNGKEGYIISDNCAEPVKDILMEEIYSRNIGGTDDLSYEICAKACEVISELDLAIDTDDLRQNLYDNELSNIYNYVRLSYLNTNNEDEIMSVLKEYQCEYISQACAIWYDQQVRYTAETLLDYINNND